MMRRLSLLAALLAAPLPALAGYAGTTPGGGSVALGGDATGTSDNATVKKLNGVTPGGSCPGGTIPNTISATAAPSNCLPTALGFTYRPGNYYMDMRSGGTTASLTANTIVCAPMLLWGTPTPSYIGILLKTPATSGSSLSIAIFANGTNERPSGAPLLQANGLVSTAAAGVRGASVSGVSLAGFVKYWQCAWSDGNPGVGATGVNNNMMQVYGDPDGSDEQINGSYGLSGYTSAATYSSTAWPTFDTSTVFTKALGGGVPALKFIP